MLGTIMVAAAPCFVFKEDAKISFFCVCFTPSLALTKRQLSSAPNYAMQ
jgi:hypothetical protein